MARDLTPETYEQAAAGLAAASAERQAVRIHGAGTKFEWGGLGAEPDVELHTTGLNQIIEHNVGDLTAILQAGVPLARADKLFARRGPDAVAGSAARGATTPDATIGGIVATADSGPLRHRYGAARDLVVGMTVALSDGTIAKSGGKVIKNVAGYDIAKLFSGAFGTLGAILEVCVRLHSAPPDPATAIGSTDDPSRARRRGRTGDDGAARARGARRRLARGSRRGAGPARRPRGQRTGRAGPGADARGRSRRRSRSPTTTPRPGGASGPGNVPSAP